MNEKTEHLRATLRELDAELARIDQLDPEARTLLEEAAREIQQALADRPAAAGPHAAALPTEGEPEQEPSPVRRRLSSAIERFETEHPTLTAVLGRLVDTLGQMGI